MVRRILVAVACVAVVAALEVPAASVAASAKDKTYLRNLNSYEVKPPVLFFAFNNGPRVVDVHWYGWGTNRAVGYGAYMARNPGSEGSEEELDVRPARVVLTDRRPCLGGGDPNQPAAPRGSRAYGSLTLITWDGRYKKRFTKYPGGC